MQVIRSAVLALALTLFPAAEVSVEESARRRATVIVAAGDIASQGDPSQAQKATARLIRRIDPRAVLPLGDTQYEKGAYEDYRSSYHPTWGRFLRKTYPVPGNHEYGTPGASGYFRYFGARAHRQNGGYYSYNLGRWHLIALNSSKGGTPSEAQLRWLRRDLQRNDRRCEIAYWHHARFSSGDEHGPDGNMAAYWRILQANGVDVVLNSHEHNYERFAQMLPSGVPSSRGVRQFVVGTGGDGLYGFRGDPMRGSRERIRDHGVLRLNLRARSYAWGFVRVGGGATDTGSTRCHR